MSNELGVLFKNIADAIRGKLDSQQLYRPSTFSELIKSIPKVQSSAGSVDFIYPYVIPISYYPDSLGEIACKTVFSLKQNTWRINSSFSEKYVIPNSTITIIYTVKEGLEEQQWSTFNFLINGKESTDYTLEDINAKTKKLSFVATGNIQIDFGYGTEPEYNLLEYIYSEDSRSNNKIVLDYSPKNTTWAKYKFNYPVSITSYWTHFCSSNNFWLPFFRENGATLTYIRLGSEHNLGKQSFKINTDYEVEAFKNNSIIVNGELITDTATAGTSSHSGSLTVFNYNNNTGYSQPIKLYYLNFYEGDNLVMELYPALRRKDNVIGLYDKINNKFYTNSGSGVLSAGPILE